MKNIEILVSSAVHYDVMNNIQEYLSKNLSEYSLLFAVKKSDYIEDNYLYMVVARNKINNDLAVWTSWNESTQSLNHGHYGLESFERVYEILYDNYIEK